MKARVKAIMVRDTSIKAIVKRVKVIVKAIMAIRAIRVIKTFKAFNTMAEAIKVMAKSMKAKQMPYIIINA